MLCKLCSIRHPMKIMILIVLVLKLAAVHCNDWLYWYGHVISVKLLNHFTHEGKNVRNLKLFDLIKFW